HLSSIPQLAVALVVCAIVGFTASNAMATAQGGTPGVAIVIGEIKFSLDAAGTIPLPASHIDRGQDFYIHVYDVIDTDSIGDPDASHGAIGAIQVYRQVRALDGEWPATWELVLDATGPNGLMENYSTNYYRLVAPYHEQTLAGTSQDVRYKIVATDGETGTAYDNPKEEITPEKKIRGVDRTVITSVALVGEAEIDLPLGDNVVLNAEAYDNGADTLPNTSDDIKLDQVSFDWTANPALGTFAPASGTSTEFTGGQSPGFCTVMATPQGGGALGRVYVTLLGVGYRILPDPAYVLPNGQKTFRMIYPIGGHHTYFTGCNAGPAGRWPCEAISCLAGDTIGARLPTCRGWRVEWLLGFRIT
ncbi:MAG: hypothetical protein JW889_11020, partial [Verrucomicrobia bacterium]|nr:hypothetical protein [Verrucomicrobiota bacterium]